jgi:pimeloyl-ACP methyl ester carboxylesterase
MVETVRIGNLTALRMANQPAGERPVLLLHGYFADATVFADWLPFFAARGFAPIALNLRGRAGSRPGTEIGGVSIDDYVEDAALAARALGRPLVVGHSMGGLLAQRLAELDLVEAAALITPAPPRGITVMTWELAIRQLKYLPAIVTSRPVRPSRADVRALVMNRVPRDQQDDVIDRLVPDSGRAGRELSMTGVPVDASRVRCPLLVVAAEDDKFIPAKTVARVARRYGVPARVMPGHGHMIVLEPGWETLAEIVADWFAAIPARGANQPVAP